METTQVKQLKLNVTNIHSFLVRSNKQHKTLKARNDSLIKKQLDTAKQESEEKKLESPIGNSLREAKKSISATPSGSIFDKILGFGSLVLAGILVNGLPAIFKGIKELVDNIVNFITPIYAGFKVLKAVITGEPLDDPELNPEKKRFSDELKKAEKEVIKVQKMFGPVGFVLDPIRKFISDTIKTFGGDDIVLATEERIDKDTGEKKIVEGFLDKSTGDFIEKQFTAAEREQYNRERASISSTSTSTSSALADSPDLKTAIRRAESGNDYGATFRAYLDGFSRRNEDITNMSINQVVQYQKDYIAHQRRLGIPETQRSAAVGAYQMLYPEVAASKTGVPLTAKFNKENQDRMADYYLNMAGYQQFINGRITAEQFNDRLAGQFASLKTTSGRGVYDTDGINKAYENLLDLIKKSKPQPKITPVPNNKGDQARVLNQRDPRGGGSTTVALQRVNTTQTVPYMMPVPTKSRSSSTPMPMAFTLSPLWAGGN